MLPFNRPYATGNEITYIGQAIAERKLSGDGRFTMACHGLLEQLLGSGRALLTTSCTDALEAAAILCDIQPGDEVIVPSFTFVSSANAFALRGAQLRFADSLASHPNLDHHSVEALVTPRTRAIVAVHYAGVACEMDPLRDIATRHGLMIVEDAAQAIGASYRGRPLGTLGDLAAFSFHETKNVISGEGGSLHVNRPDLFARAEVIREKGTNRSAFFRGEIDKYGWIDIGSSFLPSELVAAYLLAQLEAIEDIQARRVAVSRRYDARLGALGAGCGVQMPFLPDYASENGHMYYMVLPDADARARLLAHMTRNDILATFHYQALHRSRYFHAQHDGRALPQADRYTECLVRLPLYADMTADETDWVADRVETFLHTML
ncbi:dTDP-4-amino-4,6-dideoxygalactose transaminase [Sphingomonas hengshuiensis]|uniref:TDP-4-oxo-6-deoxy-D-glucose aminotransferase n=1 Tax=Sphingomonas hengshuiensis TaxID=1609977 RepID=A0A7U4J9P8_9SPHN|nr:dTDP-4-amino-4,6-dideoxygalactose transaminase [Sphingomonas hengshuiensis]AJP72840.1 TDP-4-oxo-6-deoxy-D-glucose aminotransferase [Sphingomonas hengshuiensis]